MKEDNPYLTNGFRKTPSDSVYHSFMSIFQLHNETVNIYSHLIGAIFMIYLCTNVNDTFKRLNFDITAVSEYWWDYWIFIYHLLATAFCFFLSASYHTFRNHSIFWYKIWLTIDISGIAFAISSNNTLALHFQLRCFPNLRYYFIIANFTLLLLNVFYVPILVRQKRTNLRTILFICFGLINGFALAVHYCLHSGNITAEDYRVILHTIYAYLATGAALVIRKFKVPEKLLPKTFDVWGASHQLFHVLGIFSVYTLHYCYLDILPRAACAVKILTK